MPKTVLPLTEIQVEKATATDKPVKLFDDKGLYLLFSATKKTTASAGGVEIRKGRTTIQLTGEESQFLAELRNMLR